MITPLVKTVACRHAIGAVVQLACSPYSDPLMSNLGRPRPAACALRLRVALLAARQLCCEACPSDRQCIVGRIKFLCRWPAGLVQQFPLGASTGCTVLFRCGRSLGALVAGSVVARGVIKKDLIEAEVEPRWSGTIQIIGSASLGPLLPVCGGCCEDLRRLRKVSATCGATKGVPIRGNGSPLTLTLPRAIVGTPSLQAANGALC